MYLINTAIVFIVLLGLFWAYLRKSNDKVPFTMFLQDVDLFMIVLILIGVSTVLGVNGFPFGILK